MEASYEDTKTLKKVEKVLHDDTKGEERRRKRKTSHGGTAGRRTRRGKRVKTGSLSTLSFD